MSCDDNHVKEFWLDCFLFFFIWVTYTMQVVCPYRSAVFRISVIRWHCARVISHLIEL